MIVRWPGVHPARQHLRRAGRSARISIPTLLEIAGLPPRPQQHLDGVQPRAAAAKAGDVARERDLLALPALRQPGRRAGRRRPRGDWKLIEWYEDGKLELFNLKQDLGEQHDLADQHPERRPAVARQTGGLAQGRWRPDARRESPL